MLIFNDKQLFDKNELLLLIQLFEPHSNIYHPISSSELISTLNAYDTPQSLNKVYIIPPFNPISAIKNPSMIERFVMRLNIFIEQLLSFDRSTDIALYSELRFIKYL